MYVYLVQHAEAVTREEDASRCLSDKGINDIRKISAFLLKMDLEMDKILHSGKVRALQTAQVLSDYLASDNILSETDGLSPNDDPGTWIERISESNGDMMLVGHLPHMGRLLSLLVSEGEKEIVNFENGVVICLKSSDDGQWAIEWIIKPGMLI